jgi:hypothetical protein
MPIPTRRALARLAILPILAAAASAPAQEAMYTEAATMPSPHTGVIREQFHYFRFGDNPVTGDERTEFYEAMTTIDYGLYRGLSLRLDIPLALKDVTDSTGEGDWDKGVENLHLQAKYRVYKDDTGGIDTLRAAIFGGITFPSGDDHDFSDNSISPHFGAVITRVYRRHGFNQDVSYTLNTGGDDAGNFGGEGPSDAIDFNSAYLYRIDPPAFTATSTGAWYVTAEINGLYETNGDLDLRFAPGLMYEGRSFGLEFMAQVPLYEDVEHRSEFLFAIGLGVRLAF